MIKKPHIVFHHIPKCGGMSIAAGLALTYYPWQLLRYGRKGFPGHLNARAASEAAQELKIERYAYRRQLLEYQLSCDNSPFIFGHYPLSEGGIDRYADKWDFITLLRNPIDRWYSEYYWNRYKNHSYAKTKLSIEAYLETEQGQGDTRSYLNYFCSCKDPYAAPKAAEIKKALSNIEKLSVIGTLENLPEFQEKMKTRFGRKPIFYKRNKSPASSTLYKEKFDPQSAAYKKLTDLLAADIEIYNTAISLHDLSK